VGLVIIAATDLAWLTPVCASLGGRPTPMTKRLDGSPGSSAHSRLPACAIAYVDLHARVDDCQGKPRVYKFVLLSALIG
jgi:hypothetical protein